MGDVDSDGLLPFRASLFCWVEEGVFSVGDQTPVLHGSGREIGNGNQIYKRLIQTWKYLSLFLFDFAFLYVLYTLFLKRILHLEELCVVVHEGSGSV